MRIAFGIGKELDAPAESESARPGLHERAVHGYRAGAEEFVAAWRKRIFAAYSGVKKGGAR